MASAFHTIGLYGKHNDENVSQTLADLSIHLKKRGLQVFRGQSGSGWDSDDSIDLAIVVGGDGTMLHAARELTRHDIPLVGVNLGRLGFLTDIAADDMYPEIDRILEGEFNTEARIMLDLNVVHQDKSIHSGTALNDVVVSKGELARLLEFQTYIDGEFVTSSRGDGVIVATPTGSTAYALSAGGPILHPTIPALTLVPICPHTLSNRPIVLNSDSTITFEIDTVDGEHESAHVSVDGHTKYALTGHERVEVKRAKRTLRLVRPLGHNHYDVLRSKLGWGSEKRPGRC
ncbi:MAG: NAD(+) kinase [Gammaproteobacteria bacterium]|nr:NAD(+) kinase [Gammaproteobacteria bacterium]